MPYTHILTLFSGLNIIGIQWKCVQCSKNGVSSSSFSLSLSLFLCFFSCFVIIFIYFFVVVSFVHSFWLRVMNCAQFVPFFVRFFFRQFFFREHVNPYVNWFCFCALMRLIFSPVRMRWESMSFNKNLLVFFFRFSSLSPKIRYIEKLADTNVSKRKKTMNTRHTIEEKNKSSHFLPAEKKVIKRNFQFLTTSTPFCRLFPYISKAKKK